MGSSPELHEGRVRALFDEAADLPPDAQAAWVASRCADDPDLADRVLRLLLRDRSATALEQVLTSDVVHDLVARALPDAVAEGRQVGAFQVEAEIGAGGMGRVYRARRTDGQVEQVVALKLIRQESVNPALLRRFSSERQVLASLDHPGICRFIDAGLLPEGAPYVMMELVEGKPLIEYCDAARLGISARLHLFRKVLAAVNHAHRHLVVHRDIKSGNVLVGDDGEPKLLDFGIAKALGGGPLDHTATVERFLTPLNAAPEQLSGAPTGTACDIYALGLLLYELLLGEPAFDFEGLGIGEIERRVLNMPPLAMARRADRVGIDILRARTLSSRAALRRLLEGDLDTIVQKCLRKRPQERYASVEQVDSEIARVLDGRPIQARSAERWYRLRRFIGRHRTAVTLTSALVLTVVMALVAIAVQALALADERNRALAERDRARHAVEVLRDAFAAADPARVAGAEVSAGHVLQSARERIEPLAAVQPLLFAELAAMIAEVEFDLGRTRDAATLVDAALVAAPEAMLDPALLRQLLMLKARALTAAGAVEQAEQVLARLHAMDGEVRPDWLVASARNGLSRAPEAAVEALTEALRRLADRPPGDELATAARWQLAQAHRSARRFKEGVAVLDETLQWLASGLQGSHPRVVLTRLWRSDLLRQSGALEAAMAEAAEVVELVDIDYGRPSAMAARARLSYALTLQAAGQHEEAVQVYREVVSGYRTSLGVEHPQTGIALHNLALALEDIEGGQAEAELALAEALRASASRRGESSAAAAFYRAQLARLLAQRRAWEEAVQVLLPDGVAMDADDWPDGVRTTYRMTLAGARWGLDCPNAVAVVVKPAPACDRIQSWMARHADP